MLVRAEVGLVLGQAAVLRAKDHEQAEVGLVLVLVLAAVGLVLVLVKAAVLRAKDHWQTEVGLVLQAVVLLVLEVVNLQLLGLNRERVY
jgi:hypothetical protein